MAYKTIKKGDVLIYIAALVVTLFIALPFALSTQTTKTGLFDECFEDPCESRTLLADLE